MYLPVMPSIIRTCLVLLCIMPMAAGEAWSDPVPVETVPGAGIAGTVVVDDGDTAVVRDPPARPAEVKPLPENDPAHGGTALAVNGWNQDGDGKTVLGIAPVLPAGRYAVWIRFQRLARVFHGTAERIAVRVLSADGERTYACAPRQGGQWVLLGVHRLAGTGPAIRMDNAGVHGVAAFDAAAFVPAPPPARPPAIRLPPAGDGFATIIRRAAEQALAPLEAPLADPAVAARLRARDFAARLAWDTLIRSPDRTRLWGDNLQTSSHTLTEDARRIAAMAAAWAGACEIDGLGLRGNPRLLADTLAALGTFLDHRWTPQTKWDVNWWDFEIGVPRGVLAALCLLGPEAPPARRDKVFASMAHFTVDPWKMYDKGFEATGANRIWMVENHIRRAALAKDGKGLERCRDGLPPVLALVDAAGDPGKQRDGWWRDGSFIQHGRLPYVGAYGCLLLPDLVACLQLLAGTPWAAPPELTANLARIVEDHLLPVAFEGELFPRTTGRTAGSEGIESSGEWLAIALAAVRPLLPPAQSAAVAARLRRWLEAGTIRPGIDRADVARFLALHALRTDPKLAPAPPYTASRTHAAVDLAVHHRPGWAACVAMSSTRTLSHEALWGANWRGWNQGEGVLMLYPGDPLRYRGGFWALVDPYRLPGITTSTWQLPDHDGGGASPGKPSLEAFAGGVSLDDIASVAAMRVGRDWSTLRARKSWFLLPGAVVCLGSGITAGDGRPCETIVEAARLDALTQGLQVDGRAVPAGAWKGELGKARSMHLAGRKPEQAIAWWFPQAQAGLSGERSERTGSWRNASKKGSEAPISAPWLSLILAHGSAPQDATYQYAILPGLGPEQLKAFAAKPALEILACTRQVHAVRDTANGLTAAVFFEAGTAGPFTADQPCAVLLREGREGAALAVADPSQSLTRLSLGVAGRFGRQLSADPGIEAVAGTPLTLRLDLTGSLGQERSIRWGR